MTTQASNEAQVQSATDKAAPLAEVVEEIQQQAQKRPARPKEREVFSNPTLTREIVLKSQQAQRIAKRSLNYAMYSLFSLDVILPIIGDKDDIEVVDKVISASMREVIDELQTELSQLQAVMEALDINELSGYSNPITQEVKIQSPQIAQFVTLIEKMDLVIVHVDTLWLNGEMKSSVRSDKNHEWQTRLRKLATKIIQHEKSARRIAHSKGQGEEVERLAPRQATELLDEDNAIAAAEGEVMEDLATVEA